MPGHLLHIHVAGRQITWPVRDGAAQRSTDVLELVDRLLAAVARRNSSTKDDAEVGHPFYGNQYTDVVLGPKPTATKAKGSKAAVHELLTSGHHFTLEELMAATGAKNYTTLLTAISDLKNPKYAGPTGALQILKHKSGHYSLAKADGTPLAAPKAPSTTTSPMPDLTTPATSATPASSWVAKAPAHKMSKEDADKQYATAMYAAAVSIANEIPHSKVWNVAATWKKDKAAAMAQWAANVKGVDQKPKPAEVFPEDIVAVQKLNAAVHQSHTEASFHAKAKEIMAEWKEATAKAKSATQAPPKKTEPESHKPSPVTSVPIPHPPAGGHTLPAPASIAPHDYEGVVKLDFTSGHFAKKMMEFGALLENKGSVGSSNKARVQKALEKRLTASPHFAAVEAQFRKHQDSSTISLVSSMISTWAVSSGDHNSKSCALQLATREVFKMDAAHVEMKQLSAVKAGKEDDTYRAAAPAWGVSVGSTEELESFKAGLKDFVLAQYHETQDLLKKHGVEHVYVARGMKEPTTGAKKVKLKLQPASSFSAKLSTAKSFSGGHSVFFAKVPASQVLSTYHTGFGCSNEHEVVVLSHPSTTAVQMQSQHLGVGVEEAIQTVAKKVTQWN